MTVILGSEPNPRAEALWDEVPDGCHVRRCLACGLNYMFGPDQTPHWPYCPEGAAKVRHFLPVGLAGSMILNSPKEQQ